MARPAENLNIDDFFSDKEKKLLLGRSYKGGKSGITMGQLAEAFDPEETLVDFAKSKEDDLIKLYTAAERDIQKAINKGLLKGNNLDYLKAMQTNVQTILADLNKGAKGWCEKATEAIYYQGATAADIQTKLAGVKAINAGFGQIHQQAVKVLAENTYNKLDAVSQLIGRQTDDIYRHMALTAVRGTTVGYETWQQVARNYKESLAQKGVTGFVDVTGRQWNMTTYATMVARTMTMEAHLTGTANRLQENGHDLVKVSTHMKPCAKCQPWQGVVLSLTGKTAGYPTLADAKAAGLFHVNCRHAYSLALDLDAEIAELEKELGADADKPVDEIMAQALKTPEAQLVQNLRRTGVIPMAPDAAEIELLSRRIQVEPLPVPKSGIPDLSELNYKGSGAYLGGAGEKHIYTDVAGAEYIFKPAVTKDGYKVEPFRAHVQEAVSNLGRMLYEADQVIEVKTVEIGGKLGTMQRLIPDVIGDLKKINWKVLPPEDWKKIQEEHVLDWVTGNFDAHGGNFIKLKDGRLLATDKEQSFRYLLDSKSWQMNLGYHPNAAYGEQEPIYNTIYRAFGNKEVDLDLQTVLPALKRLEAIPDDEYKALFRPYAETLKGKGPNAEGLLIAIVERKKQTRETYRQCFNQLLKKRDPSFKGTFKFLDEITITEAAKQPIAAQLLGAAELQKLTVKSLKEMAAGKGIKYAGQMNKKELIKALSEPDNLDALIIQVGERIDELKKARRTKKMKQVVEPVAGQKIDPFNDLEVAARSPIGFSVKKDAKIVEGQQVTIRRISIDEREGYQIYFKVSKDFHRDVGEEMKKLGSTREQIKFYRGYRDHQTGTYISDSSSMIRKGDAWVLKDDNIEMTFVTSERLRAYTGYCEFMVFEENGKKAAAVFKNLLQKLKMDKIASDPTPDDEYLHRLSVLAWQHFPRDEIKVGLKTRTTDEMEQFLKDRRIDPQRAKDMVEKEVFPGYRTYVEEGISKEYAKTGAVNLWAGVGTDVNSVVKILEPESPGLISTAQRFQSGIFSTGSSEDQDEASGGADSVFVRLVTKNTRGKHSYKDHYMGSGYRIIFDVKTLERKDWYAFNADSYGKTYDRYEHRKSPIEHIQEVDQNYSLGNEIMFRRGLSKEYVKEVNCDQEHQRDKLIEVFKQSGINEINGIRIDDFIKVRSKI